MVAKKTKQKKDTRRAKKKIKGLPKPPKTIIPIGSDHVNLDDLKQQFIDKYADEIQDIRDKKRKLPKPPKTIQPIRGGHVSIYDKYGKNIPKDTRHNRDKHFITQQRKRLFYK